MSDAMCQVGREEWGINMVGTCQSDRSGAGRVAKATVAARGVKVGTHETVMYQHKEKPLTYAIWADNNYVKTLSNFHGAVLLRGGMQRKLRDPVTKRRNKDFSDVDCPEQQWVYCNTYHLIDKGNGNEAKYDLATESHLHGWSPKLAARYFNMNINNAYKIHCYLFKKHHPGQVVMPLKECIHNLTHSLLQTGAPMRKRGYGWTPNPTKDITTSSSVDGRKVRSDSSRQPFTSPTGSTVQTGSLHTPVSGISARALSYRQVNFKRLKNFQPGRNHLSIPVVVDADKKKKNSYCKYKKCPGLKSGKAKRPRSYPSRYMCEQCTMERGDDFWLCHSVKKVDGIHVAVDCHIAYHVDMKSYTATAPPGSTTECSVVSDLTDE